jgi:hypothetical protein
VGPCLGLALRRIDRRWLRRELAPKTCDVSQDPERGDLSVPEREQRGGRPGDGSSGRSKTEKLAAVHTTEEHAREGAVSLRNELPDVTAVVDQGCVDRAYVREERVMPMALRAQGAAEREVRIDQVRDARRVVALPDVGVEGADEKSVSGAFRVKARECAMRPLALRAGSPMSTMPASRSSSSALHSAQTFPSGSIRQEGES